MTDFQVILLIYGINLLITIPFYTIVLWRDFREDKGKRAAVMASVGGFIIAFAPGLAIIGVFMCLSFYLSAKIKEWIKNDPTSPTNLNDPDFKLPEKKNKVKKYKPIENRFEVMDL